MYQTGKLKREDYDVTACVERIASARSVCSPSAQALSERTDWSCIEKQTLCFYCMIISQYIFFE